MLSGALLNAAMIGIVRFSMSRTPRIGLACARSSGRSSGLFSLFVAALFIVRQSGVKRLMAYSSIEHMGVMRSGSASAASSASPGRSTTC